MPCMSDGYPPSREEILGRKTAQMLCGLLSAMSKADRVVYLSRVNWKEAGVTSDEFIEWWEIHQKRDAQRKADEARQKSREQVRAKALSKLSPAERKALGIK